MHILILTPVFPFDESDTTCLPPLQALVRELSSRPHVRVSIVAVQYPHEIEEYVWHGVQVFACGGSNRMLLKPQTWYRAVEFSNKINRNQPVDAIHCFGLGECAVIGQWLERKYEKPLWVTMLGADCLPLNEYFPLFLEKNLNLIAVSEVQAGIFEKYAQKKVSQMIPWGLDARAFLGSNYRERDVDILGVGIFSEMKNWPLFFEILKNVLEKRPETRIQIIGDGEMKPELENLRRIYNMTENVKFVGAIPRPRVLDWMRRSRVYLQTSHFEGFGFSMAEAAAIGCRIVSTPVGIAPHLSFCEIGETAAELAEMVLFSLEKENLKSGELPFSVIQTADAYLALADLIDIFQHTSEKRMGDFGGVQ
jgi:glycosyltransferase involved in cell wall biosynthesis